MRGHNPVTVEEIKGLWAKDNDDECPLDHFLICKNMKFGAGRAFSRDRWGQIYNLTHKVKRAFVFNASGTASGNTFLIYQLYTGPVYTMKIAPTVEAPIHRTGLFDTQDIDVEAFNGRAYLVTSWLGGYQGYMMFVFDGIIWRSAGRAVPPSGPSMTNSGVGNVDAGQHYIGYAVETVSGYISKATALNGGNSITAPGNQSIAIAGLPNLFTDTNVKQFRIVATKVVTTPNNPNSGLADNVTYFVPGGTNGGIIDPFQTSGTINFYDSQLLKDASYLQDIMTDPPGGSFVTTYHNRLVVGAANHNFYPNLPGFPQHRLMVSRVNDPETFDEADSGIVVDPSSDVTMLTTSGETTLTGLTDGHEFRDNLYVAKLNSMYSVIDNGLEPSSWPVSKIDDGYGSFLHGIVTVLDSGGTTTEYMLVANKSGVFAFNGVFNFPEMTWKISEVWKTIVKDPQRITLGGSSAYPARSKMHFVNDPYNKVMYCVVGVNNSNEPNLILFCDYSETNINDPQYFMNVKWSKWETESQFKISSLVAFDTGTGTRTIGFNSVDSTLAELVDLLTAEAHASFSVLQTSFIKDPSNAFLHCNGFSLMQKDRIGDPIRGKLITRNSTPTQDTPAVSIPVEFALGEKIVLANHTAQAFKLELSGAYLDIRRLNIYVKPTFKTIPQ